MISTDRDNLFVLEKEDYGKLYSLAESVIATNSYEGSQIWVAAKALQDRLDVAIEMKEERLVFDEKEVQCISSLVE